MPYNSPLHLRAATSRDFSAYLLIVMFAGLVSALLSPMPMILSPLFLAITMVWVFSILASSKLNQVKLISVIFSTGQVRLRSGPESIIEGILGGKQWVNDRFAVLGVRIDQRTRYVPVLSRYQDPDDFRRLKVWLRYGYDSSFQELDCGG